MPGQNETDLSRRGKGGGRDRAFGARGEGHADPLPHGEGWRRMAAPWRGRRRQGSWGRERPRGRESRRPGCWGKHRRGSPASGEKRRAAAGGRRAAMGAAPTWGAATSRTWWPRAGQRPNEERADAPTARRSSGWARRRVHRRVSVDPGGTRARSSSVACQATTTWIRGRQRGAWPTGRARSSGASWALGGG